MMKTLTSPMTTARYLNNNNDSNKSNNSLLRNRSRAAAPAAMRRSSRRLAVSVSVSAEVTTTPEGITAGRSIHSPHTQLKPPTNWSIFIVE